MSEELWEKKRKLVIQRTLKQKDKTHSCISKHVKTFISGTPEPLVSGTIKSGLDKENFIKSLLCYFDFFFCFFVFVCEDSGREGRQRGRWEEKTR